MFEYDGSKRPEKASFSSTSLLILSLISGPLGSAHYGPATPNATRAPNPSPPETTLSMIIFLRKTLRGFALSKSIRIIERCILQTGGVKHFLNGSI